MERGYEVYRGINPNCLCDLMACRGESVWRVEVKTGVYDRHHQPYPIRLKPNQRRAADVVASVMADGVIFYSPDFTLPPD
jgi:hypothetical protein